MFDDRIITYGGKCKDPISEVLSRHLSGPLKKSQTGYLALIYLGSFTMFSIFHFVSLFILSSDTTLNSLANITHVYSW